MGRVSIETKLAPLSITHRDSKGKILVEKTNDKRLDLIAVNDLKPVITLKGVVHYRSAVYDHQGLLQVNYKKFIPDNFNAVHDEDRVCLDCALRYLGIEHKDLRKLVKQGAVRRYGTVKYLLADLNRIKAEQEAHEENKSRKKLKSD